jgi:hypothetical protein
MPDWAIWILTFLYWISPFIAAATIFFGQTYLKAKIELKIKHEFELKIEDLRAEFRKREEEVKSELRSRETEISALQSALLSGRSQRLALVDRRRLEATEKIWKAISDLQPFRNMIAFMRRVDLDALSKGAHRDQKYQEFAAFLTSIVTDEKLKENNHIAVERLFVSPLSWAYYSAYYRICYFFFKYGKMIEKGIPDATKMMDEEGLAKLLKAALPHFDEFIDRFGISGFPEILEPLSESLLSELRRELEDSSIDQTRAQKAKAIMAALKDVKPAESGA